MVNVSYSVPVRCPTFKVEGARVASLYKLDFLRRMDIYSGGPRRRVVAMEDVDAFMSIAGADPELLLARVAAVRSTPLLQYARSWL